MPLSIPIESCIIDHAGETIVLFKAPKTFSSWDSNLITVLQADDLCMHLEHKIFSFLNRRSEFPKAIQYSEQKKALEHEKVIGIFDSIYADKKTEFAPATLNISDYMDSDISGIWIDQGDWVYNLCRIPFFELLEVPKVPYSIRSPDLFSNFKKGFEGLVDGYRELEESWETYYSLEDLDCPTFLDLFQVNQIAHKYLALLTERLSMREKPLLDEISNHCVFIPFSKDQLPGIRRIIAYPYQKQIHIGIVIKSVIGKGSYKKLRPMILLEESPKILAEISMNSQKNAILELSNWKKMKKIGAPTLPIYSATGYNSKKTGTKKACIITSLANEGSLRNYLKRKKPLMPVKDHLLQQIAKTIALMNKEGLIHRDIKPCNVVVFSDSRMGWPQAYVIDYGSVCDQTDEASKSKWITTAQIASPEVAKAILDGSIETGHYPSLAEHTKPALDAWSLGALAFYLYSHKHVIPHLDETAIENWEALSETKRREERTLHYLSNAALMSRPVPSAGHPSAKENILPFPAPESELISERAKLVKALLQPDPSKRSDVRTFYNSLKALIDSERAPRVLAENKRLRDLTP